LIDAITAGSPAPGFAPFAIWSRAIHPPITDEGLARRWERIGADQRAAWGVVAAQYPNAT
jgi:hypothetical protein